MLIKLIITFQIYSKDNFMSENVVETCEHLTGVNILELSAVFLNTFTRKIYKALFEVERIEALL